MAGRNDASSLKALVVEDDAVQRRILVAMLKKFQIETTVAENGQEAVNMFLAGNKFDFILTDKDMPIMTGPEAIAEIRAMGATDVKIVGVSSDLNSQEAFMGAGADVFIPKPIKLQALESIVQEVLRNKK